MNTLFKTVAAAGLFALFAPSAMAAQSPAGLWQTTGGESRFEISLCGDGTQVCAKLVWLRQDARTTDNLPYLNKYILMGAKRALENKWRGSAEYMGETVKGTLTLVDADTLTINGCRGALCQKVKLTRL